MYFLPSKLKLFSQKYWPRVTYFHFPSQSKTIPSASLGVRAPCTVTYTPSHKWDKNQKPITLATSSKYLNSSCSSASWLHHIILPPDLFVCCFFFFHREILKDTIFLLLNFPSIFNTPLKWGYVLSRCDYWQSLWRWKPPEYVLGGVLHLCRGYTSRSLAHCLSKIVWKT